ncbi:MAG: HAMP domain-containing histidine kinase [Pyrinomonadaceae bacterium]|nr:HAMP domain-containing histidine kinase [Pyrinomonadaceae bacterium]MCX7639412.1 HAMP domain-containing histidine kinase [Pyrinomonadaceae bacterium]MDW8304538.1 HAMP domain-containing sensor histidine kinase [Acidobacteriota bacterium]
MRRRKALILSAILGASLITLAIALNVGWILISWREFALVALGIILFGLIIAGLTLNTTFLIREIRRNELQDAFLNAVTHELKTPVASIKLYLETLKNRDIPEEKRKEFYEIMLADSNRLMTTIEQILQAARLREQKVESRKVELVDLIEECIKTTLLRHNLSDSAIKFSYSEKLFTEGNKEELQTAFLNLLDNAVKYSLPDPKIQIRIKNSGKRADILIKDNGIGINSSELKQIFKRFYRAMNVPENRKGTGLGLFIVKTIIEKHGGSVWAESRGNGKGSTFVVRLPKKL